MPQPQIIYTVLDESGDRGTCSMNLPNTFSLAQFTEFGAGMATFLDAMLAGRVDKAEMSFSVDISAIPSNDASDSSDVEEIAAFAFETASGFPVKVNIPGMNENYTEVGTDDLDLTDPGVTNFITAIESGIATLGGTISPCDVGEDDIVLNVSARERFRASGSRG